MPQLHVLTGFLGSGKTTLLRAMLDHPDAGRTAVLVNEVGELGLDHHLLEQVDEDVLLLAGGCVCCALRDDAREAVRRVLAHRPDRVVLETTGLADPAPLLHTFATDATLRGALGLGGVTCVVDAVRADDLRDHPELQRQLDLCDRIVVTKGELTDPGRVVALREHLAEVAPGREVRDAGEVDPSWLFAPPGLFRAWLQPTRGDGTHTPFRTHAVQHAGPVDVDALQLWLRLVTQVDGPSLLRIKALVRDHAGQAWVVQSANRSVSPPLRLARLDGVGSEVVVIERGLPEGAVGPLLASLQDALCATPRGAPAGTSGTAERPPA
ncbi:MAG: GTP-binding protein [Myxococcota bacterium]